MRRLQVITERDGNKFMDQVEDFFKIIKSHGDIVLSTSYARTTYSYTAFIEYGSKADKYNSSIDEYIAKL